MPGKLTEQLQKTLAAGPKKGKAVNLKGFTDDWGIDEAITYECLEELIRDGVVKLDNAPDDLTLIQSIQVHGVVIHGSANTQLRLEETPTANNREESGREEITDAKGRTIRATVWPEQEGDASTGRYLLNVAVMDGTEVVEEIVSDQIFDAKDTAWAHWDELKTELSPFAAGEVLRFVRQTSYDLHGRNYQVTIDNYDDYSVANIFIGESDTPFVSFSEPSEDEAWAFVEKWWTARIENSDFVAWLDTLEPYSTYEFDAENDPQKFGDHDGCNIFDVDPETFDCLRKTFIDEVVHSPSSNLIFDGAVYSIIHGENRYPGLDPQPAEPQPLTITLSTGETIECFEVTDPGAPMEAGWERVEGFEIESIDSPETEAKLQDLLLQYQGEVRIYTSQGAWYVVAVKTASAFIPTEFIPVGAERIDPEQAKSKRKPKA